MNPFPLEDVALIAQRVYLLINSQPGELKSRNLNLGCEGQFKVTDENRFAGKSGGYFIRQLSGFGYISEGEGSRSGEILVVTRGTKVFADVYSDAHAGFRRGPGGLPVHLGFQRIWDSFANEIKEFMQSRNPTHIHCVGHSLGGALATLNADYFASLKLPVSLYTFGSPRVGARPFSENLTGLVGAENIYRVAHSTDPVTMVPAFPFLHAPIGGKNYTIPKSGMIWFNAHFMQSYVNSIEGKSWASLVNTRQTADWSDVVARAWLDAVKGGSGGIAMYSAASLSVIAQALRWLIRKAMGLGLDFMSLEFSEAFTAADYMANLLGRAADISSEVADDTLTIMNAVLQFLGRTAAGVKEVTAQFIRWVFDLLVGTLHSMASRALMGIDSER